MSHSKYTIMPGFRIGPRPWTVRWLACALAIVALVQIGRSQSVEPQARALRFDGRTQRVTLPRDVFTPLETATVEAWVRFDALGRYSRVFDVGSGFHAITVAHANESPNLMVEAWNGIDTKGAVHIAGLLRTNEWCHIAIVAGAPGLKVYFNGRLVGSRAVPVSFADLDDRGDAFLGDSVWSEGDELLKGAMADFRVWNRERSAEEIAAGLRTPPNGGPDLVAHWPLNGSLKEPSGKVARSEAPPEFIRFDLPDVLPQPAILRGTVKGLDGQLLDQATVRLLSGDTVLASGRSGGLGAARWHHINGDGQFNVAVYGTNQPMSLQVVHPSGMTTLSDLRLSAGETKTVEVRLTQPDRGMNSTNAFVQVLAQDALNPAAWLRQEAVQQLAQHPHAYGAAAVVAAVQATDPDRRVREFAAQRLYEISSRSVVAAATLLDAGGVVRDGAMEQLREALRGQRIPGPLRSVYARRTYAIAMLFTGLLATFAVLHTLFFLFDRNNRSDGFYALFAGVGTASVLLAEMVTDRLSWTAWWSAVCGTATYLLGLRLLYSVFGHPLPRRFWILTGVLVLLAWGWWEYADDDAMQRFLAMVAVLFAMTLNLVMARLVWKAWKAGQPGARVIGCGFLIFALSQVLAALQPFGVLNRVTVAWMLPLGLTAFVFAASVHLARQFVRTTRALRQANEEIARNQANLEREVSEAAAYVRSLLPPPLTDGPIRSEWHFQPSTQLGGDAFGHHWIDSERFAVYLLDVCGHGVGAALLSVSALNAVRSQSLAQTDFTDPAAVLDSLNRAFPMDAHNQQYFTAWYGVYDRSTRRLRYASAGHPPAWLLAGSQPSTPLRTVAPPIGCFQNRRFNAAEIAVPEGASLRVVSDGVYELQKANGRTVTLAEFQSMLDRERWKTPTEVLGWARRTQGTRPFDDDVSVLQVEFA
jgi:serine phosphatase RsbU (regulator of sigma subunit)